MMHFDKREMVSAAEALPGRAAPALRPATHYVHGRVIPDSLQEPLRMIDFGMGCFWGAERLFWQIPGVYATAVGYAGGFTPNPTYEEVCSGRTGHTEAVRVIYNAREVTPETLLRHFWEGHNPTQYMRQGNDSGSNYRSAVYVQTQSDYDRVADSRAFYARLLRAQGQGGAGQTESAYAPIVTELAMNKPFYYAEDYHQQYLAKNPNGYCGLKGTGIACPIGAAAV